ncbi:IQ domain-containing protein IQM6 [Spinacia oleracea]|uniref:IQ domain-containing protein IQM6 n=1 Tax=Spinacia oleracea TaxID=3562 RepID=A0ABM3RKA3_SPIOL|nr:IQ domain-containing protein IQM6-like [Spinacia oleracea]
MELIEEVTLQTPHCCNIENVDEAEQVDYSKESSYSRILHHTNPKTPSSSSLTPKMRENRGLAAVKLQKVYKSFRIRRQLADCAVLAEQKWWQVLDFAELKHSSISFFDIEKPESAVSRWSRARTRAAKVGKGSSKDSKSRKLALQHWLEAVDPRHRYGHNLQFYYVRWLHCDSNQPFFYWLDIGDGKEVDLIDRCSRSRLQQQCIKYLDPGEREAYEVIVKNGKLIYKATQQTVDTLGLPKGTKWIFVLSTTKTLYVAQKIKGKFQHSSFLAGAATLSAGRLIVHNGILLSVWPHSGHYLPTEENFQAFMLFLKQHHVDLTCVQRAPLDEEDGTSQFRREDEDIISSSCLTEDENQPRPHVVSKLSEVATSSILMKRSHLIRSKIAKLRIPSMHDTVEEEFKTPQPPPPPPPPQEQSPSNDNEEEEEESFSTAEDSLLSEHDFMCPKLNLFEVHEDSEFDEPISHATIHERIQSHRRTRSYQLGEHLQFKWTTGAGPRIGCVRDYPSRLQCQVLEQVQLSPRGTNVTPRTLNYKQTFPSQETTVCPE